MRIPMDSRILHDLSNHYDSFYLYDEKTILQRIQALREAFPEVEFLYSVKSNPHPEVLKTMLSHGFGTDAASLKFEKIIDGMRNYTAEQIEAALKKAGFSAVSSDHHPSKPWITVIAKK